MIGRCETERPLVSPRLVVSHHQLSDAGPDLVLPAIACLARRHGGTDLSVVVIDNASGDGSLCGDPQLDRQHRSRAVPVTLMASDTNLGFAGGHNAVMRAHPAAFYLLLNSDTVLRDGAVTRLLAAADAHPARGSSGSGAGRRGRHPPDQLLSRTFAGQRTDSGRGHRPRHEAFDALRRARSRPTAGPAGNRLGQLRLRADPP